MRTLVTVLSAVLLSGTGAMAQGAVQPAAFSASCPVAVDVAYTQVSKLDFGTPDPKLDIAGWQPGFTAATVRLINAHIANGPDPKRDIVGSPPDNMDSAKPGAPLLFAISPSDPKDPASAAHVTCEYEGGFALQQAVPPAMRTCSVRVQRRKASPSETTTRELVTQAETTCQ